MTKKREEKFWRDFRKLSLADQEKAMLDHTVTGVMYIRTKADGTVERVAPDELIVSEK